MIWISQRAHRKQYNFSKQTSQLFSQTTESEVTKRPGSRVQIPRGSLPGRLFPCLKRSIASRVRPGNHASKRCYIQPRALPQALPQAQSYIQYTDITRSSCPDFPRARGSLGCQQPHQIYLFTRNLGQWKPTYLCHSDPTNSQLYYMWTMWCVWLKFKKDSDLLFIFSPSVASWGMTKIRSVTRLYKRVGPYSIYYSLWIFKTFRPAGCAIGWTSVRFTARCTAGWRVAQRVVVRL